jgi:hypothetical protein
MLMNDSKMIDPATKVVGRVCFCRSCQCLLKQEVQQAMWKKGQVVARW